MTLKDVIASDIDAVFFNDDEFSETAIYTPIGGAPAFSVDIITTAGESLSFSGLATASRAQVFIKESQVSQPVYRDIIAFDGDDWIVEKGMENAGGVWVVNVRRDSRSVYK